MGMFTTVVTDDDEIQFKFGTGDDCETYRVGDEVPFEIDARWPGKVYCADGVYPGYSKKAKREDYYVVVKDHKIQQLLLVPDDNPVVEEHGIYGYAQLLENNYGIKPLPPETWSEEAWRRLAMSQRSHRASRDRFIRSRGGDPNAPVDAINEYTLLRMMEPSFFRRIMPPMDVTKPDPLNVWISSPYPLRCRQPKHANYTPGQVVDADLDFDGYLHTQYVVSAIWPVEGNDQEVDVDFLPVEVMI